MKRKPRAYSRAKRKEQIILQFQIWWQKGDMEPKTMNRIAKALDMIPDQRITDMLLELVDEGKLTVEWRDKKGRWTARYFNITRGLATYHGEMRRHIAVRSRGQAVGQLEMFS